MYIAIPAQQQVSHARYTLCLFFGLVIGFTTIADVFTFLTHNPIGTFFMMWSPGTAALLTRLLLREGFSDISFRFDGKRTLIAIGVAKRLKMILEISNIHNEKFVFEIEYIGNLLDCAINKL